LAAQFGIRGIPTMILFDAAGHEAARTSGAMDLNSLLAWVGPHLA
jgi:thioredoxin-like negative regulator of GroEL